MLVDDKDIIFYNGILKSSVVVVLRSVGGEVR